MPHLDEGTIHAWLDGALEADEAARVEEHARSCATCAAAVAEARGLVAGASRILGALDQTPGGVVPRGGSLGTRRPEHHSLWRVLHVTPARAAAAALLIVAAGTVVVVRHAPNGNAPAAVEIEAESPHADHPPIKAAVPVPKAAPAPTASAATSSARFGTRHAASGRVAPRAPTANTDSFAASNLAVAAPAEQAKTAVASSEPSVVGGAVPVRAKMLAGVAGRAAPTADMAQRMLPAPAAPVQLEGCYDVEADSVLGLPRRITLDSTRRNWEPIAGNGVRLVIPGKAATPIDLYRLSPVMLAGTQTVGNRAITVTLHRTDCPVR